jgi:hypothetical protein
MSALAKLEAKMHEAARLAKRADRLTNSAKRRLASFPLWQRAIYFKRFAKLRKDIKRHEWNRFGYVAVMMNLSRSLKFYRRRGIK